MTTLHVLNNQPSADEPRISAHADALARLVGPGGSLHTDRHHRLLYATDASLYQVEPLGVAIPESTDAAERVLEYCCAHNIALLPRGGGTSLAGQCTNHALVIDLSPLCNRVLSVDADAGTCVAEPGITIDALNAELARRGLKLFFAPDPATTRQATIAGSIGNNAAGARSIKYKRTSENLRALDVALTTGERLTLGPEAGANDPRALELATRVIDLVERNRALIRERFPRTIRRNAGYALDLVLDQLDAGATPETINLAPLLCGSEGTLALTLGANLKLHPAPIAKGLVLAGFDSLERAIDAVGPAVDSGAVAVELLDDVVLEAAAGNPQCRRYLELFPKPGGELPRAVLYVEYFAFDAPGEIPAAFESLENTLDTQDLILLDDPGDMADAWALRKAGEPLLHGLDPVRKPITFVEDNAVPLERLAEFVARFKRIVADHGTKAAYWAHASVGVLHIRPMINLHDQQDRERMRSIAVQAADLAREMGGVMSGEHGDGRVRGPLLERYFGPELMNAFRELKHIFDPHNLLNPGNITHPPGVESITTNLRTAPRENPARFPEVETYYTYKSQHDFQGAVEQCNGAGVCRKYTGGTMCPSYRATMDERHATRGRGNALRLAITGQLNQPNTESVWNEPGTIETLDLCLSCKACKAECPSNVDIAKLKAEYTAQRFRDTGSAPLRVRIMSNIRALNRLGSLTPGLANLAANLPPSRFVARKLLNLHPERSLPPIAPSLYSWFGGHEQRVPEDAPRVVLFADCFTAYNEPRIGASATNVLNTLGYRVELLPLQRWGGGVGEAGCCARPSISLGNLEHARKTIDTTLSMLERSINDADVRAFVFCEPSCLSAVIDDWLELKLDTPPEMRRRLAERSFLVEDFVHRSWEDHPIVPELKPARGPRVLLHAHCHQKALLGSSSSSAALERFLPGRVTTPDNGCCGMAGSFGYDRDKFAVSRRIAGVELEPHLAEHRGATLAAPGTSCRHQIKDTFGRAALHPIEVLESALQR